MVWDTRVNRDVGWLMVRKIGSNGLKPEEMEGNMDKFQLRSCNIDKLNQHSSGDDGNSSMGGRESEINGTTDIVRMNYDESSTFTETKRDSAAKHVQQCVDCAVQVGEEHPPSSCIEHLELKNRSTVCARESNPPLLETRLLEMSAVDIDMFENVVVTMPAADGNNNEISMSPVSSNMQVAVSSKRKKLDGV